MKKKADLLDEEPNAIILNKLKEFANKGEKEKIQKIIEIKKIIEKKVSSSIDEESKDILNKPEIEEIKKIIEIQKIMDKIDNTN